MAKEYFSSLNYSLGNEDTTMEREICRIVAPKNIMSIAGCGSRALPLIDEGTENLYCIDVATQQLYITELREKSIRSLDYEDYLKFWGFPPFFAYDYKFERKKMFSNFDLSTECRDYFNNKFEESGYGPLIYEGKWEKTFIFFSKIIQKIMGPQCHEIFQFHDLEEQIQYYDNEFKHNRWKLILGILGNKSMFNALLYKGDFINKNVPESYFNYYKSAFDHLFTTGLARQNFFLNLCFFGEIHHQDANTIEAKKNCFESVKSALKNCEVSVLSKDLTTASRDLKDLNYVSLSDVPSYFSGELEKNFLSDLKPSLAKGAVVVLRYYLRVCDVDETGFTNITKEFEDLIKLEKVGMYRVKVLKYEGN